MRLAVELLKELPYAAGIEILVLGWEVGMGLGLCWKLVAIGVDRSGAVSDVKMESVVRKIFRPLFLLLGVPEALGSLWAVRM